MAPKDPSETEQPQGVYPAAAFEAVRAPEPKGTPDNGPLANAGKQTPLSSGLEAGLLTGKTVSHYRVLEIVGGGGMGVIYRALDLKLGRSVALKFLPEEFGYDPRARERFEREARAASALDHPNICPIYEFGEYEGKPFIVMQFLRGRTLKDSLAMEKDQATGTYIGQPLTVDQLLRIAIQIADGLEAAHEKGIIHRDIKPANIFVTQRGVAKILDFGLVKLLQGVAKGDSTADSEAQSTIPPVANTEAASVELSRAGAALGTAAYMSPEQARGDKLDARTDLFCFGLLLYEMAAGRRAFSGEDAAALRYAILNQTPVPVHQVNTRQPVRLQRIINKCLEKDPDRRYRRAVDIRADLEKLRRAREHPLRRRWKLTAATVALVTGLVAGGLRYYLHEKNKFREKDTVVLADFDNTTGENLWDTTLKQRLGVRLEQSRYLNVLSDQSLSDTLKLMHSRPDERLTQEVARQVCLRNYSKAMLTGSIAKVGNRYEIDLKATNCQTGDTLASASGEAEDKDHVLQALANVGNQVRRQLGESLASVQKYDSPLPPATTASLEAIQAYGLGLKMKATQGGASAVPFFKRAIELDPDFADAYAALGMAYSDMGQSSLAIQSSKRAYELRDHVESQRERFHIEGHYYDSVTGELEKANAKYAEWIQTYPDDWIPHQNLSANYSDLGQYDKAAAEELAILRLFPDKVDAFTVLVGDYNAMNQPQRARATFDEAHSRKLEAPTLGLYRYFTAFLQRDQTTMQQLVEWGMSMPAAAEDALLSAESDTEAYYGRFEQARELSQRAAQSAKSVDDLESAAQSKANEALREAEVGNAARARTTAEQALAISGGPGR